MAEEPSNREDGQQDKEHFFVTRASQQNEQPSDRKFSYTGIRDLSDLERVQELDIVGEDGGIRGIKNRVRAGQTHFENPTAVTKKREEEGKVVVYVTSFRGVRSVNEDCRYVLTVLHNFRVGVDERDVYLHKYFYHELEERLQLDDTGRLPVPQVFISGQHIGGAQELERLNESGELRKVLANIPRRKITLTCSTCGGFKFVPCHKCGGSKNSVSNNFTWEFRALKCTNCNENGLEACPDCENTREETEEERQLREKREELERKQKLKQLEAEAEQQRRDEQERLERERQSREEEREGRAREKRERKEKARREREKKAIMEAARMKLVADISEEMERERAWKMEHGYVDEDTSDLQDTNQDQVESDWDESEQDETDQDEYTFVEGSPSGDEQGVIDTGVETHTDTNISEETDNTTDSTEHKDTPVDSDEVKFDEN